MAAPDTVGGPSPPLRKSFCCLPLPAPASSPRRHSPSPWLQGRRHRA